jgi:hypothetical protein
MKCSYRQRPKVKELKRKSLIEEKDRARKDLGRLCTFDLLGDFVKQDKYSFTIKSS